MYIAVLAVALFVLFLSCIFNRKKYIPNIIWSFWDADELPSFIKNCVHTWERHNPDFHIYVLNKKTLFDHLDREEAEYILNWKHIDNVQKLSDLVRLKLMLKYGGIWLDTSIIAFKSFDWVYNAGNKCILFSDGAEKNPTIHSWFIAAPPNNLFIREWYDDFTGIDKLESLDAYREREPQDNRENIDNNYLVVYISARKVYNKLGKEHVELINAVEGPYEYMVNGGLDMLCDNKKTFAKLRKDEREIMTPKIEQCVFK